MEIKEKYPHEQMTTEGKSQASRRALYTILAMVLVIGILTAAAVWYLFFQ